MCVPDIFVSLYVDLVELAFNGRDQVLLHLHGHVLRQHGQQQALLEGEKHVHIKCIKKAHRAMSKKFCCRCIFLGERELAR